MSISSVAQEYMAKLFGSPAVAYNVQPSQWVGMASAGGNPAQQTQQGPMQNGNPYGPNRDYHDASTAEGDERNGFAMDKWAGQFSPDLGWKDVLKAYGPQMGLGLASGPLAAGLGMMRNFKNPTRDPLWQKTANQYLDQIGNPASLADVIGQINGMYKTNLDSKVFASDTAQGALLGLGNPTQYGQASSYGMAPHQFAQAMRGYNAMGVDPTSPNTFEMFGSPTYDSLRSMGYSNQPQSSFLADYAKMLGTGQIERGGLTEQAMERGVASANARDTSNAWMDDVLTGRTSKSYADWQKDKDAGNRGWDGGSADGNDDSDVGNRGFGASGDDYY